jgi:superfamily II DNA or RNA helicase
MAAYWHQGSEWAFVFCEVVGLPDVLASRRGAKFPDDEEVVPTPPLNPLHSFQRDVHERLIRFIESGQGRATMLSLPTGAGKTRVAVQALCDLLASDEHYRRSPTVLWISQSDELQRQAWECFRQVWQAGRGDGGGMAYARRPLRLVRLWGGRSLDSIDAADEPTVFIASIDQLASWVRAAERGRSDRRKEAKRVLEGICTRRTLAVVVDEAHRLHNDEHRRVLVHLGIRSKNAWSVAKSSPSLIGLTATPWRTNDKELRQLLRFFGQQLVRPAMLGRSPIRALQRKRILAQVKEARLTVAGGLALTPYQLRRLEKFSELPTDYLDELGKNPARNALILKRLERLPRQRRVLVFACNVQHAEALVLLLNQRKSRDVARLITARTPRAERLSIIEQFRRGDGVRFLVNVGVLTTGFDAPLVDVVCIARPTKSALMYEQMVGRGLRGPKNGGTTLCEVIDVQDEVLEPHDIQSYGRVLKLWDQR